MKKDFSLTRINQAELDKVIHRHELYRKRLANGARANLTRHDLSHLSFRGQDLSQADFTGSILYEANLEKTKLDNCIFFGCDLRKANFRDAEMLRVDLRGASLRGAVMVGADLTGADLREGSFATFDEDKGLDFTTQKEAWSEGVGGVDLRGANMDATKLSSAVATNSNFEDANLRNAKIVRGVLSGANMSGANLTGADLSHCEMKDVNLRGANLSGAQLDTTNMVNVDMTGALTDKPAGKTIEHLPLPFMELLRQHQIWLESKSTKGSRLDLCGFDLRGIAPINRMNLTMLLAESTVWYGQDLSHTSLQASKFKHSDMRSCNFEGSDLRGSDFSKCNLVGSKLCNVNCEPLLIDNKRPIRTSFAGANLRYADFSGANLRKVDFTGADLSYTDFTGATLDGAILSKTIREQIKTDRPLPYGDEVIIIHHVIEETER